MWEPEDEDIPEEMIKLRQILDDEGFLYKVNSRETHHYERTYRIQFYAHGKWYSAISGPSSSGGEEGLLELWDYNPFSDPIGSLTAIEVAQKTRIMF